MLGSIAHDMVVKADVILPFTKRAKLPRTFWERFLDAHRAQPPKSTLFPKLDVAGSSPVARSKAAHRDSKALGH